MFSAEPDQFWDIFDDNLSSDTEATKSTSFDDVARIVGFSWINREGFIIGNVHFWTEEVPEHEPGSDKSVLINTGEEARQILVDQN